MLASDRLTLQLLFCGLVCLSSGSLPTDILFGNFKFTRARSNSVCIDLAHFNKRVLSLTI